VVIITPWHFEDRVLAVPDTAEWRLWDDDWELKH